LQPLQTLQIVLGVFDGLPSVPHRRRFFEARFDICDDGAACVAAKIDFLEREEIGSACHIAQDAGNGRRASDGN
jgi:hypothetical protein